MQVNGKTCNMANCPGCVYKGKTCGSRGPVDSPFVIVGESPGYNEIKKGIPFVGDSGQMMSQVIVECFKKIGKPIIQPYITNAISCMPKNKDAKNLAKATHACSSRLHEEIKSHPRKVILALGAAAAHSLTDNYNIKVTQSRGSVYPSSYASVGIVSTVHPAFLLRGGGSFPKWKEDILKAVKLLYDMPLDSYVDSEHTMIGSAKEISDYHERLLDEKPEFVGSDIETSGFSPVDDYILCLALGHEFDKNYVIPQDMIALPEVKSLLEDRRIRFTWHNGKFDIRMYQMLHGINAFVAEDTMLMSYCLDETRGIHDLEQVSADACGAPNWKAMLDQYRPSKTSSYALIPKDILHKYAGKDISATIQSAYVLKPRVLASPHSAKLYPWLCSKSNFLVEVEKEGMLIDKQHVKAMYDRFIKEIHDRKAALNKVALAVLKKEINPNSHVQVAELLYDGVKLPQIKGSRSTDADTLDLLPLNNVVRLLKDYRRSAKIYSTYVKALYNFNPLDTKGKSRGSVEGTPGKNTHSDGRVHQSYLLHGSVTGRLACRDPNVQNIPREADIRSQYIAGPGRRYIELDLNQAELRCLAELSGCKDLGAIYLDPNHPGLHHEMSVFLFGEKYTDEDKMRTKAVNFGIVYGRSAMSLAEEFKVEVEEAQRWIDGWFKRFPGAAEFIQGCRDAPLNKQNLITCFGRVRRFSVVSHENLNAVQNEASNFPHQSIASDANLESAERVYYSFAKEYDARPCNLVHDSNLWNMPDDDDICYEFGYRVIQVMEAVPKDYGLRRIPFVADGKMGYRWGHLNKVKKQQWKMRA